jgi:hypothetical protein
MYILINIIVFILVLFVYLHIYSNIKTSNYLEIYEIDNVSKEKFEELCNIKQPILFNQIELDNTILNKLKLDNINSLYGNFDINLINKNDTRINLPININKCIELFNNDISNLYISENNTDFLEETTLNKLYDNLDIFLRPPGTCKIIYDLLLASKNTYSFLKSSFYCRNFFLVNEGSVEVTLCTPNNFKYLHTNFDHQNFENISKIDIYNIEDIYKKDFSKVKLLRVILNKNQLLQIPPYWYYSIKFTEDNTELLSFKYSTFMNMISNAPKLFLKFLQDKNIKKILTKTII